MFSEVEVIHSVTVPVCLFYSALWTVGILCPRRLLVHPSSVNSFKRQSWIFYDRRRWVSLWTPGPHNPFGCWLWCMFGDGL